MIKLSKMADSVFAAFVSCRFSCDFFFFLAARGTGCGLAKFFVIILAFNGIRISGACDNLRFSGKPEFNFTLQTKRKRYAHFRNKKLTEVKSAEDLYIVFENLRQAYLLHYISDAKRQKEKSAIHNDTYHTDKERRKWKHSGASFSGRSEANVYILCVCTLYTTNYVETATGIGIHSTSYLVKLFYLLRIKNVSLSLSPFQHILLLFFVNFTQSDVEICVVFTKNKYSLSIFSCILPFLYFASGIRFYILWIANFCWCTHSKTWHLIPTGIYLPYTM